MDSSKPEARTFRRHMPWLTVIGAAALLTTLIGAAPHQAGAARSSSVPTATVQQPQGAQVTMALALPQPAHSDTSASPPPAKPDQPPAPNWKTLTVEKGDSLASLFARQGISAGELQEVMSLGEAVDTLKQIFPGDTLRVSLDDQGRLAQLRYKIDPTRTLRVWRTDSGFRTETIERHYERRLAHATAVIQQSLFEAATAAGLSERLTMELAGIFGWDVDFALDIRAGDRFSVVYEEFYLDGEKKREGDIVAAEFVNQGRDLRAVRFTTPDGVSDYYDPEGRSMRKAFLRTPVDFRRISSRFTRRRCHPILGICRPHQGVDYAAPIGTPIKAAGDGKVVFAGTKGGYGRTIILRHGQIYSTLYAHMSHIARGIRPGRRVRQGQTIGYVGRSGLATGPHLHYEFRVNGVHRNPLTVHLPQAKPLAAKYSEQFNQQAQSLLAQLDVLRRTAVALDDDHP